MERLLELFIVFSSVYWPTNPLIQHACCCCSVASSYLTLCDPIHYSMPGPFVLQCLSEFFLIHVQCKRKYSMCIQWTVAVLCYAKSPQPCPPICDLMGCSPPSSSVHGILLARTLEWDWLGWIAIPSSRGSSQSRD